MLLSKDNDDSARHDALIILDRVTEKYIELSKTTDFRSITVPEIETGIISSGDYITYDTRLHMGADSVFIVVTYMGHVEMEGIESAPYGKSIQKNSVINRIKHEQLSPE